MGQKRDPGTWEWMKDKNGTIHPGGKCTTEKIVPTCGENVKKIKLWG